MAACPDFTWSDTISGYVTGYDAAASTVELATSDQRTFRVELDGSTAAEFLRNLGEPYVDASGHLADLLVPGQYVIAYGKGGGRWSVRVPGRRGCSPRARGLDGRRART